MSTLEADASPLFALLARHWRLVPSVEASAIDGSGASVAFALGDGTLALASMADEESANSRWRVSIENGRATISPRSRPVPSPAIVPIDVAPIRLAPFGNNGFLAGGASGRLVTVAPDGAVRSLVDMDSGPVDAIRTTSGQDAFVAAGGLVARYGAGGATARAIARYEEPLRAMAPSPDARYVALGFGGRIAVEPTEDDGSARLGFDLAAPQALEWSPDGRTLAAGLAHGGIALIELETRRVLRLPDYPAPVRSLDWARDSRLLATAGAFRAIVWSLHAGDGKPKTIETGRAGFVAVTVVRLHPHHPLLALGYENGTIVIARIGGRDELVVRDPSPGAVCGLHWSPNGEHLAFHTSCGSAGILDLPSHMFK
jgi:hypothetical protein